MQSSELKQKIVTAVGWSTAAKVIAQTFSWVVTLIVIRLLSPEDYGLMAIASAILSLFIALGVVGLADAVKQSLTINTDVLRRIFGINLAIMSVFMVVLCICAFPIAYIYEDSRLVPLITVISLNLPFIALYMIPRALIQKRLDLKRSMVVEVSASFASSLTVLVMAYLGYGVWSLVIGYLAGTFVMMVGYNVIEPFLKLPRFGLDPETKRLLNFGFIRTLEQLAWYIYANADIFIIGKLIGPLALGYYNVARTISLMPVNKLAPILNPVAFSAFSLVQDQRSEASSYFLKAIRILSLFAFPTFFGLSAVAPEIVKYVLGEKWSDAIIPMQVLALASTFVMIGLVVNPFLQGLGDVRTSLNNTLVGLVTLPAALAIGCYWGVIGASVAWAITYPFYFLHILWRASRVSGTTLPRILGCMAAPLAISSLMFGAVRLIALTIPSDTGGLFVLTALVTTGVIVFCTGLAIAQRSAFAELWTLVRPQPRRP